MGRGEKAYGYHRSADPDCLVCVSSGVHYCRTYCRFPVAIKWAIICSKSFRLSFRLARRCCIVGLRSSDSRRSHNPALSQSKYLT